MRVSLPLTAERGHIRVALAALCAMVALAFAAAVVPQAAHAEFSLKRCQGAASIQGEGSSLQAAAQEKFWDSSQVFYSENPDAFGCGSGSEVPKVTFKSKSSGCGLDAMGAGNDPAKECTYEAEVPEKDNPPAGFRAPGDRFGASDFAPDPTEEKNIDNGPNGAGNPGSGEIHVIPVAAAAITVIVHFPEGCTLEEPGTTPTTDHDGVGSLNEDTSTGGVNDPTGESTTDSLAAGTLRVHIPAESLEEIWEHKITTWGEIKTPLGNKTLGEFMEGKPTSSQESVSTCGEVPIKRIVRSDTSGTTYNFKNYLALLPSFHGGPKLWTEASSEVGSKNTAWPEAEAGQTGTPPKLGSETEPCTTTVSTSLICSSFAGKGGSLTNAIKETDGSIGYVDLATAREKGFTVEAKAAKLDDTYWIPLQAINPNAATPALGVETPGAFYEPSTDPTAHVIENGKEQGHTGANCGEADYRGIPTEPASDPTLGDWSKAIATGGKAYPVCAMTYDLAFDDDSKVYGTGSEEEAKARAVKDYLTSVTSFVGQTELTKFDYAELKESIIEIAQKGVAAIGWEKTAGSSGKKEEVKAPETKTTTTTTTPLVTPVVVPSNAFSIAGAKVKGKDIVLSLVLPDAGKVQIKATGGGVTVASVNSSVSGGNGTVSLAISKSALTKIEKAKGHKLSVKITVTFTPTGGTAASESKTITLTQAELASKKNKKASKGKKK
jgi:ABC-type phosphate transport system substrate-binding protein